MILDPRAVNVLDFWLGPMEAWGTFRAHWFNGGPELDAEIARRFTDVHAAACSGACHDWQEQSHGALALVIVLDQFSRNLGRGTPKAFAADETAREVASRAIERGFDEQLEPLLCWFLYLPFEHAEDLAAQDRAVALFRALPDHPEKAMGVDYAVRHRDVIARFGRFPHRNAILGRASTPEEEAWLAAGGDRF